MLDFIKSSLLVELEFGVLVFVEGGKPENLYKKPPSKARNNKKFNPQTAVSRKVVLQKCKSVRDNVERYLHG